MASKHRRKLSWDGLKRKCVTETKRESVPADKREGIQREAREGLSQRKTLSFFGDRRIQIDKLI